MAAFNPFNTQKKRQALEQFKIMPFKIFNDYALLCHINQQQAIEIEN